MQIWVIVAYSHLQGISKNGKIPWVCKNDMKFMREVTTAPGLKNGLLMGRKTFESIGRVLPNRETIVISKSNAVAVSEYSDLHLHTAPSIRDAINKARDNLNLDVLWVFGGASVYDQFLQTPEFLDSVDGFFITTVPEIECDTFIETNICNIILANNYQAINSMMSSITLETTEDGTYELSGYSRLPQGELKKEWTPILKRFIGVTPVTNESKM